VNTLQRDVAAVVDGDTLANGAEQERFYPSDRNDEAMREWVVIYLKGLCMGAADIVPGVSGGTIALITGIYDRLIAAIAALDPRVLADLSGVGSHEGRHRLYDELVAMDLPFLLVLGAGIGSAFVLMSRIITLAFEAYPAVLNGFFFGLIAASAVVIYRGIAVDSPGRIAALLAGAVLAFLVSGAAETGGAASLAMVFLAGAIAISAMVLPGISGAAFLYILGQYQFMLGALTEFTDALVALPGNGTVDDAVAPGIPVVVFMTGAVVGLLTMARIVKRALERNRMATLGFLVGLMVGALRLPVDEAAAATETWTPGLLVAVVLAAVVGVVVILAFDSYGEPLDYTEDTAV
jgi:putative membrane protein